MDKDKEAAKLNKVEEEEVRIKKNSPALPPNYVSITQLQERWLQRKQQELDRQKAQAESKNQDDLKPRKGLSETPQNSSNRGPREAQQQRKQHQVERQKAQSESKNLDDVKPRKGFSETPQNSSNRDPRNVSDHHQVYPRCKGKELDGFAEDNGMDKNVYLGGIGEGYYRKKMHGVGKGRKGGYKEHGVWKIKEEKDYSRTPGENLYCNAGDGTASVFMVEAVLENVGKEIKPVELIRKSDRKMVKDRDKLRNAGVEETASVFMVEAMRESVSKEIKPVELIKESDGKIVKDGKKLRKNGDKRDKRSGRKSKVEELPENAMRKEDLGVLIDKNAPLKGDDDDCMVEVLLENKVKEGALLGSVRSKRSERFGGEIKRKGKKEIEPKKLSDSEDKNTLVEAMEKGMEDEVLTSSNGSSNKKGWRRRKVEGYRHRESGSEDLETGITENFRGLSFVDSRKSNVTSMGGRGDYKKYPVMLKPADNRCVWVKKGEISAPISAEIDVQALQN